ncbi:hypothetical protein AVEN_90949-1 [Araneus ventricosus]|uniref:Uncharacterized protein n=1 Tax=Araneus ventricosus TaxID=182803 RepID=A0A4Y2GY00_ARAVE|nr:hypothetical protein AVEN_90949-1 [Araneus ventricosus]
MVVGGGGSLPAGPLLALHPSWVGRACVGIFTPHKRLATTYDLACNRPIHGGSSVESDFKPETFRPQSRDLTTRQSRTLNLKRPVTFVNTGLVIFSVDVTYLTISQM